MSRLTALCLRLSLALAIMAPALCWAQENPAYQAAHQRGTTAFNAGNFAECAEEFRRAFDVEPRGNLLYNIAFCYEKASDLPNAITFYQRFIDAVPKRFGVCGYCCEGSSLRISLNHPAYVAFSGSASRARRAT